MTIIEAASQAPHDPQAVLLLTALTPNYDVGHLAIYVFYEHYTRQQIADEGGIRLKRALLKAAFTSRYTTRGYLLLSCFKGDESIIRFLVQRRASYERKPPVVPQTNNKEGPLNRTDEIISLDLALAELGRADALERINQAFEKGSVQKLQSLLRYLKFVKNKSVMLQAVELLKNKDTALSLRDPNGKVIRVIRLCDVAFFELGRLTGILDKKYEHLDEISLPNFSDQELTQAYEKLRAIFEGSSVTEAEK